jgi:arylsulfatase A-like enzyme
MMTITGEALIRCFRLLVLLAVFELAAGDDDDRNRPNVILLLPTNDQDIILGSFDHMPKVKKLLQEEGMTFRNAFVHTPICCPSRSSILTGRNLHNGVAHNNSINGNCYSKH